MTVLRWQAVHQPLGASGRDELFGTIEIRYNGQQVHNLFFTIVDLQNQSNNDLRDVDLNCVFTDGTRIYMAHGALQGSANRLPFADPFDSDLTRFLKAEADDPSRPALWASLSRRRDFRVAVLNRAASVRLAMLVQGPPGKQPTVNLACDHSGVRLVFRGPQDLIFGVPRGAAALTGLVAGLVTVGILVVVPVHAPIAAFVAFALGAVAAAIGAGLVRAARGFYRLLG
jgi:hypothetical protein